MQRAFADTEYCPEMVRMTRRAANAP
jgi:hypothetical protein